MHRHAFNSLLLAAFATLPAAARATAIDDFKLTGDGHTITYSLLATSSFPDFDLFNFFQESTITTVDGVAALGYGDYYDTAFFHNVSLVLTVSSAFSVDLLGPTFIDFEFVPANNPYPYLPYNVGPTFIPGTYTLFETTSQGAPIPYILTITPETPANLTPEPSTLALLGTGALGLIGVARRRGTART